MDEMVKHDIAKLHELEDLNAGMETPCFCEIVIRTSRFDEMIAWYKAVLGIKPFSERRREGGQGKIGTGGAVRADDAAGICFFRITDNHPLHQVLGIFEIPGLQDRAPDHNGVDHFKFGHSGLGPLFDRVERLLEAGFRPYRSANHGPGCSFYFYDPDGNRVEFAASNYPTMEEQVAYTSSEAFRKNPSGLDYDPFEFVARYRSTESEAEFVKLPD